MKKLIQGILVLNLMTIMLIDAHNANQQSQKKIGFYCICSPSHEKLYKQHFLPSIKDKNYELKVAWVPQTCRSAKFKSAGWRQATLAKVDHVLQAIEDNIHDNGIFVFTDIDIRYYKETWSTLEPLMDKYDMVIQKGYSKKFKDGFPCTGFFACRANTKIEKLWQHVQHCVIHGKEGQANDQDPVINNLLTNKNPYHIKWSYLPDTFMHGFPDTHRKAPTFPFEVPQDIVLHHATYVFGVDAKVALLEYVHEKHNLKSETELTHLYTKALPKWTKSGTVSKQKKQKHSNKKRKKSSQHEA